MSRHRFSFSIECPLAPEVVLAALTNFSDMRPKYFPNVSKGTYHLTEHSDSSAVALEGVGPFRTRSRYDWSSPGRVWSIIEESNVLAPGGTTDVRVTKAPTGAHLEVLMEHDYVGWRGKLILGSIYMNGRSRFYQRTYIRMLKNVQRYRRKLR